MSKPNAIPVVALILICLLALYLFAISSDPRMADGALVDGEIGPGEAILGGSTVLAIFATIFIAIRRAYYAGSKFWFCFCFLVWPLSFLYTLLINRTDLH